MATTFNLFDLYRDWAADPSRAAAATGTLKVSLHVAGAINQNTHEFFDDVTGVAAEVTGTGYTAGGNAAATPTWTGPDGAGLMTYDATDPAQWAQNGAGFTNARRAVLYWDTGTPATSRLVAYSDDFGADVGNVAGTVDVQFNASGIYTGPR
jgi:hypothetical protein